MDDSELLLAIAQLSVAFAGFSGLASVLGQRKARDLDVRRLQSVLVTSLLATTFSLLPFLPSRLGAPLEVAARASAGAFALSLTIFLLLEARSYRALGYPRAPTLSRLALFNFLLYVTAILGLILVVFGFLATARRGVYLFGLLSLLFVTGTVFVRVFLSLVREKE